MKKYFSVKRIKENITEPTQMEVWLRINRLISISNRQEQTASFSDIVGWFRVELAGTDMIMKFDTDSRHITVYNKSKKTLITIHEEEIVSVKLNLNVA